MLALLIALSGLPTYDIFAECDYGRVMASAACEQREQAARAELEAVWDGGYPPEKQTWCIKQVAQHIQINQYMWLKYCLMKVSDQPQLPDRVRPFWGQQPD